MHQLSAVIELVDRYLNQPAVGAAPRFLLDGISVELLARRQARYVLLNLSPGNHDVEVRTSMFLPCKRDFTVSNESDLAGRWLRCPLEPDSHYAYPAGSTLIRGRIGCSVGDGATLGAEYLSAHGRPRSAQVRCKPGEPFVLALAGKLAGPTQVTLHLGLAGAGSHEQLITVMPGSTLWIDKPFEVRKPNESTARGRG